MNHSYDALAARWREQAEKYVTKARGSANLRDLVRFIAMASTLEYAARKVCSGADVNLDEITRMINLDADSGASHSGP